MERKYIFLIVGCVLTVTLILTGLYASSPFFSKEIHRSSFSRKFAFTKVVQPKNVLDLGVNSYYISGSTASKIYLSNYTSPFHMVTTNLALTDSQRVALKIVGLDSVPGLQKFRTVVDSPYVFISHGVLPGIFRARINDWKATRLMVDEPYFSDLLPVDSSSVALRVLSIQNNQFELGRATAEAPHFTLDSTLLEKQIDGVFCVDGEMHFSHQLNKLVYLYYYRNQFIVTDPDLRVAYRGNTIDTFRIARIKVGNVASQQQRLLAAPPMRTNGISCVSGKYLFLQSNLLALNEDVQEFTGGYVIDVYDLTDGGYVYSFHIARYNKKRLSDFQVIDQQLFALFDKYLVSYDLKPS